ncbi:MAG: tripartite tricarboxylate transporter family receptor [Hyphomicrobiales bacterium]|nr:tripartite tricarboxylate transporter family receptor [Hyphomicrobiales bacterium]
MLATTHRRAILATACLLVATAPAAAQSVEAFFSAQPLTVIVGYPPGAAYDLYARLLARRMGEYLPGKPRLVVQNMPGAGSLTMANHLYNNAKQDGSVIGTFSRGITMLPIVDNNGVRYDPLKFNWIGTPSGEVSVAIAWSASGVKTFQDLRTRGMTAATSGPASDGSIYGRVLNTVLGTKIKTVNGYQGSAESMLAVERGEVDGATSISYSSLLTAKRDWIDNGKIHILAQHTLKARPELKDVPVILDFAQNEDDRRLLELVFARQSIGYPYAAPPNVPADRLAALRKAFDATLEDKEFLAEAAQSSVTVDGMTGAELQALLERIYATPPAIIERAKNAMQPG